MMPGITGLWQVSGRNHLDFHDWVKLDLEYIDNWSLWLDFNILLKTIATVLSGKGAMQKNRFEARGARLKAEKN